MASNTPPPNTPSPAPFQTQSSTATAGLLKRLLKEIKNAKDLPGISCGLVDDSNIFKWEVMLMIDDDCKYYGGGNFRAHLVFPPNYPLSPPTMTFLHPIPFHPNIYPAESEHPGLLCISILHPPQDDEFGYESASERWNPTQTPEKILLSVISLLSSPNDDSPANVEAGKLLRQEREAAEGSKEAKAFRRRTMRSVRESLEED